MPTYLTVYNEYMYVEERSFSSKKAARKSAYLTLHNHAHYGSSLTTAEFRKIYKNLKRFADNRGNAEFKLIKFSNKDGDCSIFRIINNTITVAWVTEGDLYCNGSRYYPALGNTLINFDPTYSAKIIKIPEKE